MAVKRFIDVYPNKVYLWDKEKNNCNIEDVPANSNSCMYWWRCSKGHSFRNTPSRVGKSVDEGCKECQGRTKTNFDGRSIQDVYPEIKDIWDYDKNTFFPDELPADNTHKKVWIRCYEGHSFQVTPYEISYLDVSCPVCDRESITNPVFKGIYSKLKVVWDEEENGFPLLRFNSPIKEKFFFVCEHDHKYYKSFRYVRNRLLDGKNPCPYCSGTSVKSGFNDLLTKRPDIAKYYDTDKNSVNASNIYYKNSDNRYFICKKGHSFISTIHKVDRAMIKSNGRLVGCPYCSGALLKEGYNDFESQHPELMYLWNWELNDILPSEISCKDNTTSVWFRCSNGHNYKTFISSVVNSNKEGCPFCVGRVSSKNIIHKSLSEEYPDIALLYDSEKNIVPLGKLTRYTGGKYWFICKRGHSFRQSISQVIRSINTTCGCQICSGNKIVSGINDFESQHPELMYLWDWNKNDILPSEISCKDNSKKVWLVCSNGHSYSTYIDSLVRSKFESCPHCSHFVSSGSLELQKMLENHGVTVQLEYVMPSGKRLDLYLPENNIAIEYNGIYWHSEQFVGKDYHKDKYKECELLGIRLFFVWEDDWLNKKEIVSSMILKKLGLLDQIKINARDCSICTIDKDVAKDFLDKNHIQGYVSGFKYLCLKTKSGEVVAVMVLRQSGKNILISRYATNFNVRGGFTKLLKYVERTEHFEYLETFSDNGVSDGSLYKNSGFTYAYELKPTFYCVYGSKRYHKFNFRSDRFVRDSDLEYIEGLTERELQDLNGIRRIYDAGKIKWIKKKPN